MKRNAVIRILLYSLLVLVLSGVLFSGLQSSALFVHIGGGSGTVVRNEAHVEAEPGIKLDINWAAGTVTIKRENVDRIYFRETADGEIKKPMTYSYTNDTLTLNHSSSPIRFGFNASKSKGKNLVVVVPMDWYCSELEIDGAALDITIPDLNIGEMSVDGAGCSITFSGALEKLEIDGAGCSANMTYLNHPKSIQMDGAGCELAVTLPAECGFEVDMDGLGCSLSTDVTPQRKNGKSVYGDGSFQIQIDGLGCDVSIVSAP